MSENIIEFIGHHGTLNSCCKNIRKNNFTESPSGWLGRGVYFFHDDKELAINWAIYKRGASSGKIEVLECKIRTLHDKVLDIVDPKSEQSKRVNRVKEEFLQASLKNDKIINIEDRFLDGKILDIVCKKENYLLVRNSTHTLTSNERKSKIVYSSIDNGVELCVKDIDIICFT